MKIQPYFIGSGRAALAIEKSLQIVGIQHRELATAPAVYLKRGQSLSALKKPGEISILVIANPHGLHCQYIIEADRENFDLIVVEKPACVNLSELEALKKVKSQVAICHVYRQMWGPQTLRSMIERGEFGELISVEGRYWQSSTAQRALSSEKVKSWKNEIPLSGESDAFIDVGCHWADMALYFIGQNPVKTLAWKSYANAEAPHRDSHVHLLMKFASGTRALASISKTYHGAPNHFEINIIGTKKSATWKFLEADQLEIGEGSLRQIVARKNSELGSQQPPFHGLGWLEGYVEILYRALLQVTQGTRLEYPRLEQNLELMSALLNAEAF